MNLIEIVLAYDLIVIAVSMVVIYCMECENAQFKW